MATITQGLDEGKVKAFIQRMVTHLTGASIGLMLEVGRQTGLFETLAVMAPATSSAIAERAGLIERYVREWLGAMVCGGIVDLPRFGRHPGYVANASCSRRRSNARGLR